MPNWCNNKLIIEDCSPELAAYLQENGLSFDKIKPNVGQIRFLAEVSPPCKAIAALSAMFPSDSFILHYLELGMMFAGTAHISNGEIIKDDIQDKEAIRAFALEVFDYDLSEGDEE